MLSQETCYVSRAGAYLKLKSYGIVDVEFI